MRGTRTFADTLVLADHAAGLEQALETLSRDLGMRMDMHIRDQIMKLPLGTRARNRWSQYPPWFQDFIQQTWWDKKMDIPNV